MSSIYQKGRDGYYYYQAYIPNKKTGKKDKRIFHSLKTKDKDEAIRKQVELDRLYKSNHKQYSAFYWIRKNSKNLVIIVTTVILTHSVSVFISKNKENDINQNHLPHTLSPNTVINDTNMTNLNNKRSHKAHVATIEVSDTDPPDMEPNRLKNPIKIEIPAYDIARIEKLSGVFEQGKLYVTTNKNSSNESQRLLCKKLTERFTDFSNIVICLFSADSVGNELAKGNEKKITLEERKKSWLAMYTYNSVEGEYFDDNPSSYLDAY